MPPIVSSCMRIFESTTVYERVKGSPTRMGRRSKSRGAGPVEGAKRSEFPRLVAAMLWLTVVCGCTPAPKESVDLLIQGGVVVTMDDQRSVFDPGFVTIRVRRRSR